MARQLNAMQELFCIEYIKDFNATEAAKRAGYSCKTAYTIGQKLTKKNEIRKRIAEISKPRVDAANLTIARTLEEIRRIAYADPINALNEDNTVKSLKDIPEDLRRCIAAIDVIEITPSEGEVRAQIKKIKFWPKDRALEMAGRYFKLFTDKLEHSGEVKTGDTPIDISEVINDPNKAAAAVALIAALSGGAPNAGGAGVDTQQSPNTDPSAPSDAGPKTP